MSRVFCLKCHQLEIKCICESIIKLKSPIPIFIIRDHKEKKHPFNTVNILELNLEGIQIIDVNSDENVDELILEQINHQVNTYLIFPTQTSIELSSNLNLIDSIQLIFIDGSWKKAKKIYYQSNFLQSLPTLHLKLDQPSQYQIRRSNFENSLSTIEAVTNALNAIDMNRYNDLLKPFLKLVEMQKELEEIGKKKGSD